MIVFYNIYYVILFNNFSIRFENNPYFPLFKTNALLLWQYLDPE